MYDLRTQLQLLDTSKPSSNAKIRVRDSKNKPLPLCDAFIKEIQNRNSAILTSQHKRLRYLDKDDRVIRIAIAKLFRPFNSYSR
jgi:hypothetical protein